MIVMQLLSLLTLLAVMTAGSRRGVAPIGASLENTAGHDNAQQLGV